MLRIAVGGLMHESNTFAASRTDLAAFEAGGLTMGDEIATQWSEAHHEVGGFFEAASELGFEIAPTMFGWAAPSGPLTSEAYGTLSDRLIGSLRDAGPVDAVLLAMHGAMVAEDQDDGDGAIHSRVRDLIGPDRPLVVTLDYHGNVSPRMVAASNALIAYRTYPHVDQRARGRKAAEIAWNAAGGRIKPTQALSKPPLLIDLPAQETTREPLRTLMAELEDLDRTRGLLDASILAGFPYADVATAGPSCVVVTDNSPALASQTAARLSERLWQVRRELIADETPGLTASNPPRYTYHKIRRPILPLDPEPLVEATLT
jgi:microcystin degradation protein MlrC